MARSPIPPLRGIPGNFIYRDGISFPTGNLNDSGARPVTVWSISAVSVSNGYAQFNYAGVVGGSYAFGSSGGTFQMRLYNSGGTMTFGRDNTAGGTIVDNADGGTWGGIIPGSMSWSTVATKPLSVSATSTTAGQLTATWSAPSSNGGETVTGYRVQAALNAGFTTGLVTSDVTGTTTATLTGLNPGQTYYVRVAATNSIGRSEYTTAITVLVLAGAYYGVSGVWKPCEVYYGLNGVWVPVTINYGSGGTWKPMA